jgi:phospholipase/carboxylesterase
MDEVKTTRVGENTVRVVQGDGDAAPSLLVILCHGYGAPGTDLVPLARELAAAEPSLTSGVRFLFPEAPISLGGMGFYESRAWWHIDPQRFAAVAATGDYGPWTQAIPEGLAVCRRRILGLIDAVTTQTGLPMSRIVLGGFSQGAMLATDVALRMEEAPCLLAIFSGTLICEEAWTDHASRRAGLPVFQTHGRQDALLPFEVAGQLRSLLTGSAMNVDFHPFEGGHTIDRAVLGHFGARLAALQG